MARGAEVKTRHTIAIYLAPNPSECRVLLDGANISHAVRAVDVHAHVADGATNVVLHLIANVEIFGEPGALTIHKPSDERIRRMTTPTRTRHRRARCR